MIISIESLLESLRTIPYQIFKYMWLIYIGIYRMERIHVNSPTTTRRPAVSRHASWPRSKDPETAGARCRRASGVAVCSAGLD